MEITIAKMVYGGDGMGRAAGAGEKDGKTTFVPFVLEGEKVQASVAEEKPGFIRATAEKVIASSPFRVEPQCPYFYRCGGCHYQHASYEHQLGIKSGILRDTLRRTGKIDWSGEIHAHASPPWNYRNRARLKMRTEPFAIGYYGHQSHQLIEVRECPISSALINRAIRALWELDSQGSVPQGPTEIELFANAEDSELLVETYIPPGSMALKECESFYHKLAGALPEVAGMACFEMTSQAEGRQSTFAAKRVSSFGKEALIYRTKTAEYQVSAGSFFQTNRFMTDSLIELATGGQRGSRAVDLYAGAGLFAVALAKQFETVTAVESAPSSFHDLEKNAVPNVTSVRTSTEQFLSAPAKRPQFDFVIVDPPRAGLGPPVVDAIVRLQVPTVTYVSCDPATLARDLRGLLDGGHRIDQIHLIDLFPQTYHLETVVRLVR